MGFFSEIFNLEVPFIRNAILCSILSGIIFGVLGSIISVKRFSSLAGAISHAVLGGIGIAIFLSSRKIIRNFSPLMGALIFALLIALIIGFISLRAKQREDAIINALWAVGMSTGLIFISKSTSYVDPMSYLFGNILLISDSNLILLAIMDIIIIFLTMRFYSQLEAMAFDEEFAKTRGINTSLIFISLLIITAISIVLLQTFVGIVMVIAMLTLPAVTSEYFSHNLGEMMLLSTILSIIFSVGGLLLSWILDLPAGPTIVVVAGITFFLASLFKKNA